MSSYNCPLCGLRYADREILAEAARTLNVETDDGFQKLTSSTAGLDACRWNQS